MIFFSDHTLHIYSCHVINQFIFIPTQVQIIWISVFENSYEGTTGHGTFCFSSFISHLIEYVEIVKRMKKVSIHGSYLKKYDPFIEFVTYR